MDGENLRDGTGEVALEQRTQRQILPSRLRRIPALQGDSIGKPVLDECRKFFSEIRWYRGLIRPKLHSLGHFFMQQNFNHHRQEVMKV